MPKLAFAAVKLPDIETAFVNLSNVKPVLPAINPLSENNTVVFAAVTVIFASTLPTNLPAVTVLPAGKVTLPVLS